MREAEACCAEAAVLPEITVLEQVAQWLARKELYASERAHQPVRQNRDRQSGPSSLTRTVQEDRKPQAGR